MASNYRTRRGARPSATHPSSPRPKKNARWRAPPCVSQDCAASLEVDIEAERPVPPVRSEGAGVIQPVTTSRRANAPTERHDEVHRGPVVEGAGERNEL